MGMIFCRGCGKEIHDSALACPSCGAPQKIISTSDNIPDGIRGWSWGAFFLNWIWAISNRVWWGLLALIPYVGFIAAIWLGFKGRELAWTSRKWDSVEHFQRVQKKWSNWGVGLVLGIMLIGIIAAIAIPSYAGYQQKAAEAQAVIEAEEMAKAQVILDAEQALTNEAQSTLEAQQAAEALASLKAQRAAEAQLALEEEQAAVLQTQAILEEQQNVDTPIVAEQEMLNEQIVEDTKPIN